METYALNTFEIYEQYPDKASAYYLLDFCGVFFYNFLVNANKIVIEQSMPYEVQLGILNNSYQKMLKTFQRIVHKKTDN